jgi:poly-gamma-glutamate capsule biosynthesis protein CapA/YwtB (metallophosphatase superfamily)
VLEGLRRAGVDGLMLSNNHALDQGEEGLVETLTAAHEAGFVTSGAGHHPRVSWPVVVGDEGARVTLVPFYDGHRRSGLDPGTPALADLNDDTIAAFGALRGDTELLVPVVHVLGEAVDQPKPRWRVWAQQLAEAGADLVVVHGTHVPLPVELLVVGQRRVPIVWGLGNFVGDMARQATPRRDYYRGMPKDQNPMLREGLLLRVELTEGQAVQLRFLPLWMNDDRYVRFWGGFERAPRFRLLPVAACGAPIETPSDWPPELSAEMMAWIAQRRDHLVGHAGLSAAGCQPGVPALLPATALAAH